MTPKQIDEIMARMENAGTIEKKDIYKIMRGTCAFVRSYDFGIVSTDEGSEGPSLEMSMWDYDFLLHAADDIRDLVEALEEVQKENNEMKLQLERAYEASLGEDI